MAEVGIQKLAGRTLARIDRSDDELQFHSTDGRVWRLYHRYDCCESVYIEDIVGDLDDLIGVPILEADERTEEGKESIYDSSTWTFYRLSTIKGTVVVRWLGTSNGYYSESVDFEEVTQ